MLTLEMQAKLAEADWKVALAEKSSELKVALAEKSLGEAALNAELKLKISEKSLVETVLKSETKLRIASEESALNMLARVSAILANRCLLESALNKWDIKHNAAYQSGIKAQYYGFLRAHVLSGPANNAQLFADSKDMYNKINLYANTPAKEGDVKNELNDLPLTLSAPMHYTTKPISGVPGCYIGGGLPPFSNALGICIAILKKEGCCPETVYLVDEFQKPFAKISDLGIERI